MNFDIGLPPMATLLLALLVFAIICDFLVELYSVRMSLSTGGLQSWLFDHVGQNIFADFIIAIFYQFLSFRKKAFFTQISSLINVGSFPKKQVLVLLLGSFVGSGCSLVLLAFPEWWLGLTVFALGLILGLIRKEQFRDFGMALVALGLFLLSFFLFETTLASANLNIHNYEFQPALVFSLVAITSLIFRTPVAFLIVLAVMHHFVGFNMQWLPVLFLLHCLCSQLRFYWNLFRGRARLFLSLGLSIGFQLSQFLCFFLLSYLLQDWLVQYQQMSDFSGSFSLIILLFFSYQSLTLLLISPFIFLASLLPFFGHEDERKSQSQKIIVSDQRGHCFSIHLYLFLLRQEFKKFTTSVHTVFKISRETSYAEDRINQKFVRYQGMLNRVGDELKELCFSIGRQRSYRWQVKEIMSYYRYVNQLELLVEDLGSVTSLLRQQDLDENWEKECRYWLGLQLKLFESFFHFTLGVGHDDLEKVRANIEKSYEVLDRFFVNRDKAPSQSNSQTFYRITESIANLSL